MRIRISKHKSLYLIIDIKKRPNRDKVFRSFKSDYSYRDITAFCFNMTILPKITFVEIIFGLDDDRGLPF